METHKWSPLAAHVLSGFESTLRITSAIHLCKLLRNHPRLTSLHFVLSAEATPMPAHLDLGIEEGTLAMTVGIFVAGEPTTQPVARIEVTAGELFFVCGKSVIAGAESLALSLVRLAQTNH